jgi:ABC-type branched-subunit amino acid transport system ATPase component
VSPAEAARGAGCAVRTAAAAREPLVEVHDLARHFGGVRAVDGASFTVARGTITGLIGPNGAGKSTVAGVVSGFLAPTAGRVVFDGEDITGWPAHRVARRGLVRTFQLSSECPRLTVLENLLIAAPALAGTTPASGLLGRRRWGRSERLAIDAARELLHSFGLADAEDAYAGELSGGQKRLLEIARAVMRRPSLLLLDEPFAGVNPTLGLEVQRLLGALRDAGLTMVLIEHELDAVERLCDTVVVMALGRVIAEGTMSQLRANREVVDAYLGG